MGRRKGGPAPPGAFKPGHPNMLKPGQIPNPKGRESTYTEELGERIVNLIWEGECKSITAVSRLPGMPTRRTLHTWARTFPAFGVALLEARCALGDVYDDEIDRIKDRLLAGELEANQASVAIKSNQWKAMAVNPRDYSTKSYVQKDERVHITTEYVDRIQIDNLDDEQLDAIEFALKAKLLTGPDGGNSTPQ